MPAIEQALFDGLNINVTLLFAVAPTRRSWRPTSAPMERRAGGRAGRWTAIRSRRSSSRAWTPRSTSASRPRATPSCRARPAWPTPAPPTRRSSASSRASASPRCARPAARSSARCGRRPASRTRPTRRRCTSGASSAPHTVNTMPMPTLRGRRRDEGGVTGATAAEDPTADLAALADAGIDLDDVTDKLLRDGIDAFMVADAEAAGRDRGEAGGDSRVRLEAFGQLQVVRGQELLVGCRSSRVGPSATIAPAGQQHRALAQRARRAAGRG